MLTQGHLTSHSGTSDCSICEEQDTEITSQTRHSDVEPYLRVETPGEPSGWWRTSMDITM